MCAYMPHRDYTLAKIVKSKYIRGFVNDDVNLPPTVKHASERHSRSLYIQHLPY